MPHGAGRLDKPDAEAGLVRQFFDRPPNSKKLRCGDKNLLMQVERGGQLGLSQYGRCPQAKTIQRTPNRLAQLAPIHRSNVHRTPFPIEARHRDAERRHAVQPLHTPNDLQIMPNAGAGVFPWISFPSTMHLWLYERNTRCGGWRAVSQRGTSSSFRILSSPPEGTSALVRRESFAR